MSSAKESPTIMMDETGISMMLRDAVDMSTPLSGDVMHHLWAWLHMLCVTGHERAERCVGDVRFVKKYADTIVVVASHERKLYFP